MKKLLSILLAAIFATGGLIAQEKSKSLVVYFSLAGEQYAVGNITEGNTSIVAKMIAQETGADLFELETVKTYPTDNHRKLVDEAKTEQSKKARPALKKTPDISAYDTIYIGYPNWWGDMPMCIYTFIESQSWSGKTIVPFCTHEGSGLSGTESTIRSICKGATVAKGLAVQGKTAQNNRTAARKAVQDWLKKIGK